ncbi:TPR-like protein [Rickenella mellea]|uniref:TPR-like protein n=1 Tax=Rickenella mellea TaxID=50990 RepID=A0A4Y7QG08_9AGAM|nr:TPR-like protein [Rickenella mellea]
MSTLIKTKLKRARDCIGRKDYAAARDAAADVLSYEPENYNANVFLGLCLLELGQYDQSEQCYKKAIESSPEQPLARQGILKFYEKTERWGAYDETILALMDHYSKSDDSTKCAEMIQKHIEYMRQHGSQAELTDALRQLLPGSSIYPVLSNLPAPDPTGPASTTTLPIQVAIHNALPTIEEIVQLTEKEETSIFLREVDKRRMRLGASGPEEIKKEVGREIWSSSKLPELYEEILNHPNTPDELRRSTESKILRWKLRYQSSLAPSGDMAELKVKIGSEVDSLINGVVLLNVPDELAWTMVIEGKDCDQLDGYDFDIFRRFMDLFPTSSMSELMREYLLYSGLPLHDQKDEDVEAASNARIQQTDDSLEDPMDRILDSTADLPNSILAHRILAECYAREKDHDNAIKASERGLEILRQYQIDTSKQLPEVCKAFNVILATGLVHLFPPKHHARALRVIEDVLQREADNTGGLMGRAYVLQAAGKFAEAAELFNKVSEKLPDDMDVGLEAKEEFAWCKVQMGKLDDGAHQLQSVRDQRELIEGEGEKTARVWWRLGKCYWDMGEATREESYRHFITALKRCPTFAPAFTSLGIYYSEFATPPDPNRSSKCFQKAFELDAREVVAARRLASGFAEEREWDLVEVVARRTIEGEGNFDSGLGEAEKASMARYRPMNAWAWKAVGAVELNRRNYPAAIQAYQLALRTDDNDSISWLHLGEAYTKAGRHAAALKALHRSRELDPDNWICSYHIGEVQRQMGQLQEAIDAFRVVMDTRPMECGVLVSLAESYLELGRSERSTGFLARSQTSFLASMTTALRLIDADLGFRRIVWKTVSDCMFELSEYSTLVDPDGVRDALLRLEPVHSPKLDDRLLGLIDQPLLPEETPVDGLVALKVTAVICSYRVALYTNEEDAIASAWFDLALALFRLSTRAKSTDIRDKTIKQSIEAVKTALSKDPGNVAYWNALGNFNFTVNATLSQHGYIRALELDHKNASTWTNLGLLYLHENDTELANEAFLKAQTLDPGYTLAWVGQALVATANGHDPEARALLEHAVGLSADVPEADLEYSYRTFRRLSANTSQPFAPDTLLPAFFCLDRYCKQRSTDASALHLFALVCERLGHEELSTQLVSQAISLLEAEYEETEDAQIEQRYAVANANLGRLRLCLKDYSGALDAFETAFSLLPGDDERVEALASRAMCQFGSGLAHFHQGDSENSIQLFESALEIAGANLTVKGQVTVLLSQVLWGMGREESRESAKNQLLECITDDPDNLAAVIALAGMGLLTDDDALIEAAFSEILGLSAEDRQKRDPGRDVEKLLSQHYLAQGDIKRASLLAQGLVHAEPSRDIARQELALLTLQEKQPAIAQALLSHSLSASLESSPGELHRSLRIVGTALASGSADEYETRTALKAAQKAVILAPWELDNWRGLAFVRTTARRALG